MLSELRDAWRQAVENFWRELGHGSGSTGAYREVRKLRDELDRLDRESVTARERLDHERDQLERCLRRERLAERIGDRDTARVAAEYAGRHREHAAVLERKLEALEGERRLFRRDMAEMERALQSRAGPDPQRELDDLNRHPSEPEFEALEEAARRRAAEERLAELKRKG